MMVGHDVFGSIAAGSRAVVLVEGSSDQIAVETLAARLGRQLAHEGVEVLSMGGVHAFPRFLERFGPHGANLRVAGLYDAGEAHIVQRALRQTGFRASPTSTALEALGFFVCVADLEDELIRALGAPAVEAVIASEGDLNAFRTLQKQTAWRERGAEAQLRRFMGSGARRKARYAHLLVDALDPDNVPRPLRLVLEHVR
jgi:hypothetical protein